MYIKLAQQTLALSFSFIREPYYIDDNVKYFPAISITMKIKNQEVYKCSCRLVEFMDNYIEFFVPAITPKIIKKYNLPYRRQLYSLESTAGAVAGKKKRVAKALDLGHNNSMKILRECISIFNEHGYTVDGIFFDRESGCSRNERSRYRKFARSYSYEENTK